MSIAALSSLSSQAVTSPGWTASLWTSQTWWYTARAGGIVAWVLLAASLVWGLLLSTKVLGRRGPRPAWLLDLHRFLGALAVIFTAVHVGGLVADSYTHFGPSEVLVPFASSWKPAAVAWGVIGMYLLAAIEITSLLRKRIPRKVWRATHLLSFPLFGLSTLHALSAGTDAGATAWRLVIAAGAAAVIALTVARQLRARAKAGRPRPVGAAPVPAGRLIVDPAVERRLRAAELATERLPASR